MKRFNIHVNSDISYVEQSLPARVVTAINKVTSYELDGAWVAGRGPRRAYLFSKATQKFPSGLLKRVKKAIKESGYKTRTIDYRNKAKVDDEKILKTFDNCNFNLRYYQADGIIEGIRKPYGLYWWPTGSGKTLMFSCLLMCYNTNALILTHRKELLYQLQAEISLFTGKQVGIIGDGNWSPKKWTVGIVNSLTRKTEEVVAFLKTIRYFIGDEIHHIASKTWGWIAKNCKNTIARHGFSGTCFRTDKADLLLLAHTGDVISKYTTTYMIEEGWLSRPNIYRDRIGYKGNTNTNSSWNNVESELISNNPDRNFKGCQFIYDHAKQGDQVLVMVRRVNHGKILSELLQTEFGIESRDVRYMSGEKDTETRRRALQDYKYGMFPILIGTSIYDEGIDLPSIGSAANMAGGDSDIKTTQRLGRAIRKTKKEGEIDVDPHDDQEIDYYDPFDNGHRFVRKHSRHRQELYEGEKAFKLKGEYNCD